MAIDLSGITASVARNVPKLKTPIQLAGVIVAAGFAYLGSISNPPNLPVQITAGLIVISVIVFSVGLNLIKDFPAAERARFVVRLFAMFLGAMIVFMVLAVYLSSDQLTLRARAAELSDVLRKRLSETATQVDEFDRLAKRSDGLVNAAAGAEFAIRVHLEKQQSETHKQLTDAREKLGLIEELLIDLNQPKSNLTAAIEQARAILGVRAGGFSLIAKAEAGVRSVNLKPLEDALDSVISEAEESPERRLSLAWVRRMRGALAAATAQTTEVYQNDPKNPMAIESMAELAFAAGDYDKSAAHYDELIAVYRSRSNSEMLLALALKDRATATRYAGDLSNAFKYMQNAEDTYELAAAKNPVVLANIQNDLGGFMLARDDLQGAKKVHETALAYFRSPGASNYGFPHCLANLADVHRFLHEYREAESLFKESVDVQKVTTGLNTSLHARTIGKLAQVEAELGRFSEAERTSRLQLAMLSRLKLKEEHSIEAEAERALARRYQGDESALVDMHANFTRLEIVSGRDSPLTMQRRLRLSETLRTWGDIEGAFDLLKKTDGVSFKFVPMQDLRRWDIEKYTILLWRSQPLPVSPSGLEDELLELRRFFEQRGRPGRAALVRLSLLEALVAQAASNLPRVTQSFCAAANLLNSEFTDEARLRLLVQRTADRLGPMSPC